MGTVPLRSRLKRVRLNILAFLLFRSQAIRLLTFIANGFQLKTGRSQRVAFPFVYRRRSRSLQILVYHRIVDEDDPFFPPTPINVFARQMDYLAARVRVLPLGEAVERLHRNDVPDNAVVVTFDDGYRDNYVNAFPILRQLSIPATIFLATGAIGTGTLLWHDTVFSAFRETRRRWFEGFDGSSTRHSLATVSDRCFALKHVLDFLRSVNDEDRRRWIDRLIECLGVEARTHSSDLMLRWDDVRAMHRAGISFGSHTVNHPILSRESPENVATEIRTSKRAIEAALGVSIDTFAYPSGRTADFTSAVKALVKEEGFLCGVTAVFGTNAPGQDPYELRRGTPWETYLPTFALKLNWYRFSAPDHIRSGSDG